MLIKNIIDEDFTNYKKCSMFVGFPSCTFKCEKEPGGICGMCQNAELIKAESIECSTESIVSRYLNNPISHAIVCGGLEPFDSFQDLLELVKTFRNRSEDDIVIYTGYYANEISDKLLKLSEFQNIIIKFGRFIPNQEKHFDEILGIYLASDNQYAERL